MTDWEQTWRELAEAEMRYRGYSDEEIDVANRVPAHTPECEFEGMQWNCWDEYGKSFHPVSDEYGEIVDVLGRAMETLAERSASEVKVLTETATKVAYALGRKDAGEEIAQALEAEALSDYDAADDLHWAAEKALAITSQPQNATSDATSGVPGHQEVSEAVRSPQEPCGHPTCPCASQEAR